MCKLTLFSENQPEKSLTRLDSHKAVSEIIHSRGACLEQWPLQTTLAADASEAEVLAAYRDEVAALCERFNFQTVDVASLQPDHPQAAELRAKFLTEHTHDDFEARFFVAGSGMFYIHVAGEVLMLHCQPGDLILLPANTPHWFDMGAAPMFKAIRFFRLPEGWVGKPTGSNISDSFPRYEPKA